MRASLIRCALEFCARFNGLVGGEPEALPTPAEIDAKAEDLIERIQAFKRLRGEALR